MYRKDSVISLSTSNRTTPNIAQNHSSGYKSGLAAGSTSQPQASCKATSSRFSRHPQVKQAVKGVPEGAAGNAVANDAEGKKGGILSDFSFVQVFSSALAAITSTLLSAHIGIIGGIVAVGVGAAVSAMASQVYKALLEASHQKLKEVAQDQTTLMPSSAAQVSRAAQESQGAYQQHGTQGVTQRIAKVEGAQSANVRIAPGYLRSRAQQERRRKIVAAVLIAAITLAAVGATAAVINLATKGDGLGTKTNFGTVLTQQSPTTTSTSPTGTTSKNPTATTNDTSTQSTSSEESSAQSNGEQESQDSSQSNSSSEDGTSTSGDSSSEDTSGTSDSGSSDGTTSESDQNSQQGSSDKTDGASGTTEGTSTSNSNPGQTTTTKTS